jgi:hypothetical protein
MDHGPWIIKSGRPAPQATGDHREATGLTNDTTRLFGLEGLEVVSVEINEDDSPMLALVTACEKASAGSSSSAEPRLCDCG